MCMAQHNLNTRMQGTENEAFMLWIVDPSMADVVMVVTEGMAKVAVDVMVAMETDQQLLMALTFQTPAIHLQDRNGKR